MKRLINKDIHYVVGYHTQEHRPMEQALEGPIKCHDPKAWLGVGYYFWTDIVFAKYWGVDFKLGKHNAYDVYSAHIEEERLINAVFDQKGYDFFVTKIDSAIEHLKKQNINDVKIGKVHRYLAENIWSKMNITGIIYDDLPRNKEEKERVFSEIHPLYYKKRIQIVTFGIDIIKKFDVYLEEQRTA